MSSLDEILYMFQDKMETPVAWGILYVGAGLVSALNEKISKFSL